MLKCPFDRLLLSSVSDLSLYLMITRFWLIFDIMESEGNQSKQIKPHKDALEDTLVLGINLTLVTVTASLPGGPEIWNFGLQANTPVNMLLYSWNPNEQRMFVKHFNFLPILSQVYYITRAVNLSPYIVTGFSSQKAQMFHFYSEWH